MINFILGSFVGSIVTTIIFVFIQVNKHNEIIEDCEIEK